MSKQWFAPGGLLVVLACSGRAPVPEGSAEQDPPPDLGDSSSGGDDGGSESDGGSASDSGDTGTDSCAMGPADGVRVSDVVAYQVVAVDLLENGAAVAPPQRAAPLIAGRNAVVRIGVHTDTPRELEARVVVGSEVFSHRKTLTGTAETFRVDLPANVVQPDGTMEVSIVECGGESEAAETRLELGAESTGSLKLHLVPFEIGGFVPDTSPAVLDGLRDAVLSVYPVTDVELTVGDVVPDAYGGQVEMGELLVDLGVLQEQVDEAPIDVYYYGLVTGAATREEFCDDCPTGTSESGGGNRAGFALGAAFADQRAEDTLIHELGHMHGLLHAPCGGPSMLDEDFPYADAAITSEGYDFRADAFVPADHKDMMAYCYPRWISDYNYDKLVDWVRLAQTWAGRAAPRGVGQAVKCFDPAR